MKSIVQNRIREEGVSLRSDLFEFPNIYKLI